MELGLDSEGGVGGWEKSKF